MNGMSKRTIFSIIGVFLLLLVGWSYHRSTLPDKASDSSRSSHGGGSTGVGGSVPVVAGKAAQKDVPIFLDGLGTVQAFNTVTVHTRVDGQLVQVNFSEGQDVKTGDLLAVVDPKPYQAALDQAKAQAALDQVTLKRQADLRARN